MICIKRTQTDPYFNIAAEEYALKAFDEDIFMLWINDPSIIVGKHQNSLAEINYHYVKQNNIPVIRRISGGGTVFHDHGNLNFTFITSGEKEKLVDFRKFTDPIVKILNEIGVPARFEGKNDLRVKGLKISGNAEHVFRNRVLHHGTLLFNSKLGRLNEAIKVKEGKYVDKAVKSNRCIVTNISDHLPDEYRNMSIHEFKSIIEDGLMRMYPNVHKQSLSEMDILAINKMVEERYALWEWNFGYSPKFQTEHDLLLRGEPYRLQFSVKNGIVEDVGELNCNNEFNWSQLVGSRYNEFELPEKISELTDLSFEEKEMLLKQMF